MAQIIDYNPEDNPRLNEIYQILLLAGYFRIRISSLKAFDKVVGGIAWCITSSNFEVQVEYNDEMQIGQKIKVSEHICRTLESMNCPYTMQPFELQGLQVNKIYPIVQWLVKFVYQTRYECQKYNREISDMLSRDILQTEQLRNTEKVPVVPLRRIRVNKQIVSTKPHQPIRVYSALLEFGNATATKMYQKLHSISLEDKSQKKGNQDKLDSKQNKSEKKQSLQVLQEESELAEIDPSVFGQVGKVSLVKLEQIIEKNKQVLQEGIKEQDEEQQQQQEHEQLDKTKESEKRESNQQVKKKDEQENKMLKLGKMQNQKYQAQIQALTNQLQSITNVQKQIIEERQQYELKQQTINQSYEEIHTKYVEIQEIGKEIKSELGSKKQAVTAKVEKMVERKIKLKAKKAELKKKAKNKLEQLQRKRIAVQAALPQIDEQAFHSMIEEAQQKKEIYDKKYEQLTKINQELAILQRKTQNFISPAEIIQYHTRFVALFESINCLIEEKRSIYNEMTNLESVKKMVSNYQQFLGNAKEGITNAKKKQMKLQLVQDMKEISIGFQTNLNNSSITLQKLKSQREATYAECMDFIKQQRQYLKVLRNFKVEYENVEKYYK